MAIITISRGSYSRGKKVAEALAAKLDYKCVSRDILLETCAEFSIPEIHMVKALHDAPSILDRFNNGKERYISCFRAAFLNHMLSDNIVYHGLAGHFFLQDCRHTCKVRIIANLEDRIKEEMKRENCSAEEARYQLKKDDEERRKWSQHLYGKDTLNSSLYDLIFHIDTLTVEDVVDILENVVRSGKFDATPESTAALRDSALLANIHAQIVKISPRATLEMEDNIVTLGNLEGSLKNDKNFRQRTAQRLMEDFGLKDVIFTTPVSARKDHVNTFYNLDY